MSLNMYLGEVQSQTQSMNAVCTATIQGMEQAIQSIDAFAIDTVLQGQTYSSAKSFFVQTFRPLAQGIIYLCEELIRQNNAFPNDFQSQVASTDVIEQEIRAQIQEINQTIASIEAIEVLTPMPGVDAIVAVLVAMRKKLEEKLEHLYEFNYTSSNNYSTALQLAASIATGLTEVQSGKGFSPASGTFNTQDLNMEWTGPIQAITESKAQIEKAIALREQEANRPWYEKTAISTWEFMKEFFQGAGSAAFESVIGLESPDNDELESKLTYQAGRFTGNVIAGVASIIEILEGLTVIGGSNFLTLVATVGTGGLASPIAITFDAAATAAGVSLVGHGVFVGRNAIQNGKDTLQKFQSSSPSGGGVKGTNNAGKSVSNPKAINTVQQAKTKQKEVIHEVESGNVKLKTNKQKGNYGEMKMDVHFESKGFDRISNDRVTSLDDKIVKGIDGVYYNQGPPPKYIIGEAKYSGSKLSKTKDGRQMSDTWIEGKNRLEKVVGKDVADDILLEGYDKTLVNIREDGTIITKTLDITGNIKK
ncbi:T7SS effector LXG polymorphic toxin [Bacillus wiedmannii]|uniref:T7SS effector LXG polymorphic toxin n=1 Tax=Bacillus wiedmannii TaxID=1890302 RepID=UPI000BF415EB|nr:T7SS effector LXG polymorphic toxin [Bacillus wiedmannii]PGB61186.1 hypothetical protein COM12_26495 [Bacillus wiedmannii]